jgi:hypothetical protein
MTTAVAGAKDLGILRKLEALTGGMLRPERKKRPILLPSLCEHKRRAS